MKSKLVNLNFESVFSYMKILVQQKAFDADSTIVYSKNGVLIEENPKTHVKKILKKEFGM